MLPTARHKISSTCRTQDSTSSHTGSIAAAYGLPNDIIPTRNQEPRLRNPTREIASRPIQLSDTAWTHSLASTLHLEAHSKPPHNQASTIESHYPDKQYNPNRRKITAPTTTQRKFCNWQSQPQTKRLGQIKIAKPLNSKNTDKRIQSNQKWVTILRLSSHDYSKMPSISLLKIRLEHRTNTTSPLGARPDYNHHHQTECFTH